ncbi:hypothetical protein, partial [Hyphomicrobium sp.]|uniref:hypothetical protein n=1 Tax=Hyphomicrobium sp. TaxID=82 RepID=UPI003F6FFCAB
TGGVLEGVVGKSVEGFAERAVVTGTHAAVGGALSVAQGGSFMEGFASAGLGSVGGFIRMGLSIRFAHAATPFVDLDLKRRALSLVAPSTARAVNARRSDHVEKISP